MPRNRLETNYVSNIETKVETKVQAVTISPPQDFELINLNQFCQLAAPKAKDLDLKTVWHNLLGNNSDCIGGENPQVKYLTKDSAKKIIEFLPLFDSGIDFQHLPAGFLFVKNPNNNIRDVLHYSSFLDSEEAKTSPLAITLSVKKPIIEEIPLKKSATKTSKEKWFEFLKEKAVSNNSYNCNEEELLKAWQHFTRVIDQLELSFYEPNFKVLEDAKLNPIVLLGRWTTVMRNPHLKKADRLSQWEQLLKMRLHESKGIIRAITDYNNTTTPCRFIMPGMQFDKVAPWNEAKKYPGYNSITKASEITGGSPQQSEQQYWRYLAYQPERYSLDFYQQLLKETRNARESEPEQTNFLKLFAGSTTGINHSATADQEADLKICTHLFRLTKDLGKKGFIGGSLEGEFITHLTRLNPPPNLTILKSLSGYISDVLKTIGIGAAAVSKITKYNRLAALETMSNHLNALLNREGLELYEGARFFFKNGEWKSIKDISFYIKLQASLAKQTIDEYSLMQRPNEADNWKAKAVVPCLSTFFLTTQDDIKTLLKKLETMPDSAKTAWTYCLNLFKDVTQRELPIPLTLKTLVVLSEAMRDQNELEILAYVEEHYAAYFKADYFTEKRQQLKEASEGGLSENQKAILASYNFLPTPLAIIENIESTLVRAHSFSPDINNILNELNEKFALLQSMLTQEDFALFLQRLSSLKEQLAVEKPTALAELLNVMLEEKTTIAFNQIFLRNKIEKSQSDNKLFSKYVFYMRGVRSLVVEQKIQQVNTIVLQETIASIILQSSKLPTLESCEIFIKNINKLVEFQPQIQDYLFLAINNYPKKTFSKLKPFTTALQEMTESLNLPENPQYSIIIYTLLAKLQKKPDAIPVIWETIKTENSPELLKLISCLLPANPSDGKISRLNSLLVKLFASENKEKLDDILTRFQTPPYPSIATLLSWLEKDVSKEYEVFSKAPFGKRHLEFAFNLDKFNKQRIELKGVEPTFFKETLAKTLDDSLKEKRNLSIKDLKTKFTALREKNALEEEEKIELMCVAIEMLARTTAQQHDKTKISQELNSTQVLALYTQLFAASEHKKIISEIETGEGKSRISMVLAACTVGQGYTVDFLTSDMLLAERDFFAYNSFFAALDIKTSLISLNTPPSLYQKGGVNFSDNSQLLLLRNKADIELVSENYLEKDSSKRCVLVDEVDKFKHDKVRDSYNYAAPSSELINFTWVYARLINFMSKKLPLTTKIDDAMRTEFIKYVQDNEDLERVAALTNLNKKSSQQLITWLNAASTALELEEGIDYKVTAADEAKLFAFQDNAGNTVYSRKVLVVDNGRPVEGSSFSDGIHQCLCAIENKKANEAKEETANIGDEFFIPPETSMIRSSYTNTFLNGYNEGLVYGLSGTTRSEAPIADEAINYEGYKYIRVPREHPLKRKDRNAFTARSVKQQQDLIKDLTLEHLLKKDGSVLIICKDDKESESLYKALKADPVFAKKLKNIQYVEALTSKEDEIKAISQAGNEGMITISTAGMMARGVDINAKNLSVFATYIPTFADTTQIKGRTARAGRKGSFRMVINLADKDTPLKGNTYNIHNEIRNTQKKLALEAVFEEETSKLYANFLEDTTQKMLMHLKKYQGKSQKTLKAWKVLLNDMQQDWDANKHVLLASLEKKDLDLFKENFLKFCEKWQNKTTKDLNVDRYTATSPSNFNKKHLAKVIQSLEKQYSFFQKKERQDISAQKRYEAADDGQARIYSSLFVETRALLTGKRRFFANYHAYTEGHGVLFADLKALLNGERSLFANVIASIKRAFASFDKPEASSLSASEPPKAPEVKPK